MKRLLLQIAAVCVICWGVSQMAKATYIHSKASLAQALIKRAWSKVSKKGRAPKPWPWADTAPVARLGAPTLHVDLMVLEGGSGRTLAFGPGHVAGTALPGERGNSVIGGHRDTHFRFLKDLKPGDTLLVETSSGDLIDYEVSGAEVVDERRSDLLADFGDTRLTLITCYPFDAILPGGPLRYVVTAMRRRSVDDRSESRSLGSVTRVETTPPAGGNPCGKTSEPACIIGGSEDRPPL